LSSVLASCFAAWPKVHPLGGESEVYCTTGTAHGPRARGDGIRQHWETDELAEHWTLDDQDMKLLRNKTGATRLGFAVLLKFFEQEGRFLSGPEEAPVEVVEFIARQLGLSFTALAAYDWSGRSWKAHRAQIRKRFGFRDSTEADAEALTAWLAEAIWPEGPRREQAEAALAERCRAERVEPPSVGRIARILNSSARRFDERFAEMTLQRLPAGTRDALEKLLIADSVTDAENRSVLAFLKSDPGQVGLESMLAELDKLARLRTLDLPAGLFRPPRRDRDTQKFDAPHPRRPGTRSLPIQRGHARAGHRRRAPSSPTGLAQPHRDRRRRRPHRRRRRRGSGWDPGRRPWPGRAARSR
jgi:Domain of unknown function (DUF4158)